MRSGFRSPPGSRCQKARTRPCQAAGACACWACSLHCFHQAQARSCCMESSGTAFTWVCSNPLRPTKGGTGKGDGLPKGYGKIGSSPGSWRCVRRALTGGSSSRKQTQLWSSCSKRPGALEEGGRGGSFLEENLEGKGDRERAGGKSGITQ